MRFIVLKNLDVSEIWMAYLVFVFRRPALITAMFSRDNGDDCSMVQILGRNVFLKRLSDLLKRFSDLLNRQSQRHLRYSRTGSKTHEPVSAHDCPKPVRLYVVH